MNFENIEIWNAMKNTKYSATLDELKDSVDNSKSVDEALAVMLKSFSKAVHAEAGTLWCLDKVEEHIIAKAFYGGGSIGNIQLDYGSGIVGNVIEENKSSLVEDCQKDRRWSQRADRQTGFTTKSMICIPLVIEGYKKPFGAVQILNKTDGTLFDNKDLQFAEQLAKEMVRLLIEKTDIDVFELIDRERINLGLDEDINLFTKESAINRLQYKLDKTVYKNKEKKEIIDCFTRIYDIVDKHRND